MYFSLSLLMASWLVRAHSSPPFSAFRNENPSSITSTADSRFWSKSLSESLKIHTLSCVLLSYWNFGINRKFSSVALINESQNARRHCSKGYIVEREGKIEMSCKLTHIYRFSLYTNLPIHHLLFNYFISPYLPPSVSFPVFLSFEGKSPGEIRPSRFLTRNERTSKICSE